MHYHIRVFCFLIVCKSYVISSSSQPEVTIKQGIVRGLYSKTYSNRRIASFEGIPYAQPPIGKNRFEEPVPASPWIGIYNATREPPQCLQLDLIITKAIQGSEDCLYINVYTPQLPEDKKEPKLLDVLAYIHGGAFLLGKSGFTGASSVILERDVVLVTFNYRLGPLGFLSTEDEVVPGNNGLKDQVLALKWIKNNIAAFGGNPKSVTIGGISAGGASCHYHLLSPLSKGLFERAIIMSGVALNPWTLAENVKEKTMVIATDLGCPTNDSHLMTMCLKTRPAEHIVALSKMFLYWGDSFPLVHFAPVIEPPSPRAFISETPIHILKEKQSSDVPVILSYNLDEGLCGGGEIITKSGMFNELLNRWDELIPHVLDYNGTVPSEKRLEVGQKIRKFYEIADSPEGRRNLIKMIGDRLFVAGISKVAKISASVYNSPVYVYRFSYKGKHSVTEILYKKGDIGISHGDDGIYTIGFTNYNFLEDERDSQLSKQLLDDWMSFMANGTLGDDWKPVKQELPKIVFTDIKGLNNFQLTTVDELGEESFWDSLELNEITKSSFLVHKVL